MRKLALSCFFLLTFLKVIAQDPDVVANHLIEQYNSSVKDSNAVLLLLRIDSIYLYQLPDTRVVLDSVILMAQQARKLSEDLDFQKGRDNATFFIGNSYAEKQDMQSAVSVMNATTGKLKIRLLIMLGERYFFRAGDLRKNQDSALVFMFQAKSLSESIHDLPLLYKSLGLLGKYYFAIGQFKDGEEAFMRPIRDYNKSGNIADEAHWWSELGKFMPDSDSTFSKELYCHNRALVLYQKINDRAKLPSILEDIAFVYQIHNQLGIAIQKRIEAVELRKSLGQKALYLKYADIAQVYLAIGNNQAALYYSLAAINNADSLKKHFSNGFLYLQLGECYRALKDPDNSIPAYKEALRHFTQIDRLFFPVAGRIVSELLKKGNAIEALNFIDSLVNDNKPVRIEDKETIAASKAECFRVLHKYDLAEKQYLEMIKLDNQQQEQTKSVGLVTNGLVYTITGSEANYIIASFYAEQNKFNIAMPYLVRALSFKTSFAPPVDLQMNIHYLMFKADSAAGNYISAIRHYSIHKSLNDSIFNEAKSKQIEELKIQYQTTEKEKDLKLLQSKEQVQAKELEWSFRMRTFISILALLLMIMLGFGFSRYRLKQQSNLQLEAQQAEINAQYLELTNLNKAQEKTLVEKEWLIKEIHHRVKNNLQMIISLLNAQSEFLDHPSAIQAIKESRERMQAVALMHQKLYQPDEGTPLNMLAYIQEMVNYLGSGFANVDRITFKLDIEDINLDVSRAIPLGLILNEAITNVIKYAFSSHQRGILSIALRYLTNDDILLQVKDNGKGLPEDFDVLKSKSLGIHLIELFAEQLDGTVQFFNSNGLEMRMVFKQSHPK